MLRAAGIAVTEGVQAAAARRLNAGFLSRVTRGRPILTLKLATSLDGRIATAAGESRWITGPAARLRVHAMRAAHDAVLVGGGTARADDPELTVRGLGTDWQPVRIVAAAGLDLPRAGRLAASVAAGPLWLLHAPDAPAAAQAFWSGLGARLLAVPRGADGALDPVAMLARLGDEGLTRVYCEGGGALAAALLRAGVADRLAVFAAGLALGADGRPALGPLPPGPLAAAPRFALQGVEAVGSDILSHWDAL